MFEHANEKVKRKERRWTRYPVYLISQEVGSLRSSVLSYVL